MRMAAFLVAGVLTGLLSTALEAQEEPAGYVKIVMGAALITRGGIDRPARPGDAVHESDRLRTGVGGRLGVTLKDDTRISLGSNSEIDLSHFKFSPAEGKLGLAVRLLRGVAEFISGQIATLRPEAVRLETPATIVGVRGTHVVLRADSP